MAYGATRPLHAPTDGQLKTRAGGVVGTAVLLIGAACCLVAGAVFSVGQSGLQTTTHTSESVAAQTLQTWQDQIATFAAISQEVAALKAENLDLADVEKTEQNTCLNSALAELTTKLEDEKVRNRGVIGADFKDEATGKDDYANARNKVALKDDSYKPVGVKTAEKAILNAFMHAGEVVEASKFFAAESPAIDLTEPTDKEKMRLLNLLQPESNQVSAAMAFIERVKEDFPDLVKKCFTTDCPPGKGFTNTDAGPKCTSCVAGETWNGITDAEPCTPVTTSCPAGEGYSISTMSDADSTCNTCGKGLFSSTNDNAACAAYAVTTCSAGEELTAGTASTDGSCTACQHGKFNPGSFNPDGTSYLLHGATSRCMVHTIQSCPAGQQSKEGNSFTDTTCADCESGTFSTGGGAACGPHGSTHCSAGFQHVSGGTTSAHTCEPCPAGHFKAGTSSSACAAFYVTSCPAGQDLTPGTADTDGVCTTLTFKNGGLKVVLGTRGKLACPSIGATLVDDEATCKAIATSKGYTFQRTIKAPNYNKGCMFYDDHHGRRSDVYYNTISVIMPGYHSVGMAMPYASAICTEPK